MRTYGKILRTNQLRDNTERAYRRHRIPNILRHRAGKISEAKLIIKKIASLLQCLTQTKGDTKTK